MRTISMLILVMAILGCAAAPEPNAQRASINSVNVTCPVNGGAIGESHEAEKSEHEGQEYFFCCRGCKEDFDAHPEKYTP